jgi:hypothetical protein
MRTGQTKLPKRGSCPDQAFRDKIRICVSFVLGKPIVYLGHTAYCNEWIPTFMRSVDATTLDGAVFKLNDLPPYPINDSIYVNVIDQRVVTNIATALFEKFDALKFNEIARCYWYAMCAPLHASAVHFGSLIEQLQNNASEVLTATRGQLLDNETWRSLQRAFQGWLEAANLDPAIRPILRSKISSLNQETVALFSLNHLPDGREVTDMAMPGMFSESSYAGVGFSLGCGVNIDVAKTRLPGSLGEYFWGGAAATAFWIDPEEELTVVFMTQVIGSEARLTLAASTCTEAWPPRSKDRVTRQVPSAGAHHARLSVHVRRSRVRRPRMNVAAGRLDAGGGSLQDARASSFQPPSCFCQTCMTPILVLVTLPSSSLSETQRCRTTALFPTTWTVSSGHSSDLKVAFRVIAPSMNLVLSSSRASEWL